MSMLQTSAGDNVQNWNNTDWSVNKKGYRHRVYTRHLCGDLKNEYTIMFKLRVPVEIKEI